MTTMNKTAKIYIAGHNGMVGSAIVRKLIAEGYENLIMRNSCELDLTQQNQVAAFFTEAPAGLRVEISTPIPPLLFEI